jgi:flagellar biosynthesis/type III secretory pathway protein FliH
MQAHDNAYKNMFSSPSAVEQLKKQALARGEIVEPDPPPTTLHTITELQDMLSGQLDSWERDMASKALLLGKLEGMQLGEQRGLQLGEQRGMQIGVQQGKLEGLLEGKFEAQSYTLRRLLSRRFGVLSSGVSAQIAAADISQIETWLDRVLDASSVAEVLRNH